MEISFLALLEKIGPQASVILVAILGWFAWRSLKEQIVNAETAAEKRHEKFAESWRSQLSDQGGQLNGLRKDLTAERERVSNAFHKVDELRRDHDTLQHTIDGHLKHISAQNGSLLRKMDVTINRLNRLDPQGWMRGESDESGT